MLSHERWHEVECWLDPEKQTNKQLKTNQAKLFLVGFLQFDRLLVVFKISTGHGKINSLNAINNGLVCSVMFLRIPGLFSAITLCSKTVLEQPEPLFIAL